jgi:rubrerythrin
MLDLSTDADGIADFLTCLSGLEQKNAQLFQMLSEKTIMPSAKPLLYEIAQDNQKHAKQLQEISKKIGNPTVQTKQCKQRLSVVCENTETILRMVKQRKQVTVNELSDFLQILESSGGAAQYLLVQAETFLFMSQEITKFYGMDANEFNQLLQGMVQDIEKHIDLLEQIKTEIEKQQSKNKKTHPVFKYQSPDSWYSPGHSQKTKHVI